MKELLQALSAVPAGGAVLLCGGGPELGRLLHERRRDQVQMVAPSALAERSVLAAIGIGADQRLAAELCRVAARYAVITYRTRGLHHRDVEAWFAPHGFRPLARAARRFPFGADWCGVFLRDAPAAG